MTAQKAVRAYKRKWTSAAPARHAIRLPAARNPPFSPGDRIPLPENTGDSRNLMRVPVFPHILSGSERIPVGNWTRTARPGMQCKLAVGPTDDDFEREADRAAERVMRMPETGTAQRTCATCPDEEDDVLRSKADSDRCSPKAGSEAPPLVRETLRSPGRPLDAGTRSFMEARLGHDFGRVRVHTGRRAAESAAAVGALAYTVGSDVAFASGRYAPSTDSGQRLLAHELAHVAQQGAAGAAVLRRSCSAHPNMAYYLSSLNYCKDTPSTGKLHPGQDCFREIPSGGGCPPGEHVCFDRTTGKCNDHIDKTAPSISRDPRTGLCNLKWLGGCSIVHGLKDVVAPRLGVEGSVRLGGAGPLGGAQFTTIAGANLTGNINRIHALRLGARGIYMTPDRLLIGGVAGYRARIVRPVYFDTELGLLGEVVPSDAERLSRKISFFASAGVGTEHGRKGTKFFWRVGGFVIISDEKRVVGGATGALGVRFR